MSLELILIVVLGLVVLAEAALIWMLWQRPTPTDSSQEVAALKARLAALTTPDLAPLHQMVNRLEAELAELKSTPWRGHPAHAEAVNTGVAESPDAGGTPAVQGDSPLLRPEDSTCAELGGGGEALGERSDGETSIQVPDPDAGRLPAVRGDAGGTPAAQMDLGQAKRRTEELLNQTHNPTDRAYLTGLHERLINARQVNDLEEWDNDRNLIFGLYQPISDIGPHELSDDLRPTVQEIGGLLDEARAEAIDHLRVKFGVEVIAPVIRTPFDPLVHEDSPATRLTPPSANLAHTIYARVGLGLKRGAEVIEKAWVKRYAGYEGPTEVTPEPQDPEVHLPLPPAVPEERTDASEASELNDNAAKSLLQQAAEHAD